MGKVQVESYVAIMAHAILCTHAEVSPMLRCGAGLSLAGGHRWHIHIHIHVITVNYFSLGSRDTFILGWGVEPSPNQRSLGLKVTALFAFHPCHRIVFCFVFSKPS